MPERRQVQFRIGVNLGDVMVQEQDLLGDGVNVAARLQSAAAPGGICISGSVYDQIRNRLSLSFKPLGDMNFKNIPQAVRTFSIVEAEGLGVLPSPGVGRNRSAGGFPRWLAAAVAALMLLLAGGGAFWAYSDHQRRAAEIALAARSAAEKLTADKALARAEADRKKQAAAQAVAPAAVEPPRPAPATSGTAPATDDGVYAGPICFGPTQGDPARCFPVQATLQQGSVSAHWPGRDPGVTMNLAGDVSASGHVTIHMHGEKPDGSRLAVIDFSGTLRDGVLDAAGSFANGRTATLNWRKSEQPRQQAAAPEAVRLPPVVGRPPEPAPATPTSVATAGPQGLCAGPICYGAGPVNPARCFRAQATLQQGRISGQWPGGDPGVTMHLEGDVSPSGQVTIHMHSERADGSRLAVINLTGTLRDGRLDATGSFANGRTASLNWRKS